MILTSLLALSAVSPRLLMAHYMPWFETKAAHGTWGWHWTMGKTDLDSGQIASKFHPLIGPYDSRDSDVIEYQLLTMKMAGIDGVFVDWYGINDLYDYAGIHAATKVVFAATKRYGMKFGVVYEDQTLKSLIEKKVVAAEDATATGAKTVQWLAKNWFPSPHYLRIDRKPALLVFGPQFYKSDDWKEMLNGMDVSFFTLHHRVEPAVGAYDWPIPGGGDEGVEKERQLFLHRSKSWPHYICAAYPRFQDYYKEAGLHDSFGSVSDDDGKTFVRTLTNGLSGNAPVVQIATWNDWGEGTQIEPSREFGYRDLEATQSLKSKFWPTTHKFTPSDLKLPARLFSLRKKGRVAKAKLERVSAQIVKGDVAAASKSMAVLETSR